MESIDMLLEQADLRLQLAEIHYIARKLEEESIHLMYARTDYLQALALNPSDARLLVFKEKYDDMYLHIRCHPITNESTKKFIRLADN